MPLCEKHTCHYDGFCRQCNNELIAEAKASSKKEKAYNKRRTWKVSSNEKTKARKKLKDKLQKLVADRLKARFKNTALWMCWIEKKTPIQKSGLFSLHCAHFYAKSSIWQLANHPHNVFPCSYAENVIKPQNVGNARPMMISIYGKEAIEELDRLAAYYLDGMNKGIENKKPTDMQLIAMIEETTQMPN